MKVKISTVLLGIQGEELKAEGGHKLLLKDIMINAILTPIQDDKEQQKWLKYEIFKKIRDAKDIVELTVEDVSLIKKAIGKLSPPLIYGQCVELIEGIKE